MGIPFVIFNAIGPKPIAANETIDILDKGEGMPFAGWNDFQSDELEEGDTIRITGTGLFASVARLSNAKGSE